jgi:hypothetical protein
MKHLMRMGQVLTQKEKRLIKGGDEMVVGDPDKCKAKECGGNGKGHCYSDSSVSPGTCFCSTTKKEDSECYYT